MSDASRRMARATVMQAAILRDAMLRMAPQDEECVPRMLRSALAVRC